MLFFLCVPVLCVMLCCPVSADAAVFQYIGTGKTSRPIEVTFSRDKGANWKKVQVKAGQTFNIPRDATHLLIDNVPRDPTKNYKAKDGVVF